MHYGKEMSPIFHNDKAIQIVYHLSKVVWQAIRSCFGGGFWQNDKAWLNDEGWKN